MRDTVTDDGAAGELGAVVNERVADHVPLPPALRARTRAYRSVLADMPVKPLLFPFVIGYDPVDEKLGSLDTCNSKSDELSPPHADGSVHDRVKDDDVSDDTDGVPGADGA